MKSLDNNDINRKEYINKAKEVLSHCPPPWSSPQERNHINVIDVMAAEP